MVEVNDTVERKETAAICVFCGSSRGKTPEYAEAAISLGRAIAKEGRTLVYGGGSAGLMGLTSSECRKAGGHSIGIVPRAIAEGGGEGDKKELPIIQGGDGETIFVGSMHERKMTMAKLAEGGYVSLPGGFGTFEEAFEVVSWTQLGVHEKPMVFLNVLGYFSPLRELIKGGVEAGFIRPNYAKLVSFVDHTGEESFDWGEAAMEAVKAWKMPEGGGLFSGWSGDLERM